MGKYVQKTHIFIRNRFDLNSQLGFLDKLPLVDNFCN